MIKVISLFGNMDLQELLMDSFKKNKLSFINKNCQTEVQLLNIVEEYSVDVAVIAAAAIDMSNFFGLVDEIYHLNETIRIILILYGTKDQYQKNQLEEYSKLHIDLIFDDNGFDSAELIDFAKQGKRKKRKPTAAKSDVQNPLVTSTQTNYSIAIFGLTHGAGVTSTVVSLARFFGLQNKNTAAVDFTGTQSLALAECKEMVIITEEQPEIDVIKSTYAVSIFDFGVPYEITSDGSMAKIATGYNPTRNKQLLSCDIKIGVGFLEPWQVSKAKYLFNNEQWKLIIDTSFVFLFDKDPKPLKRDYPHINMYHRNDEEFREIISNLFLEGR